MKAQRVVTFFVFGACLLASAQPIVVPSLGPRYKQTRERVDELFRYRNGTLPVPDPQLNLFRVAAYNSVFPELPVQTRVDEPAVSDEMILKLAVATLKGGTLTVGGRSYLTINQKRHTEGDIIVIRVRDRPVSLLLKHLTPNSATFSYKSAEIVVPL